MRSIRYQEIAAALRQRVVDGEYAAGALLPSEARLSEEFGASRVTVRRALEMVRDEGFIAARQGFGWFVAASPVRQTLARLGTIEAQMEAEGLRSQRRVLEFAFVPAGRRLGALLETDQVLRVKRLNLADGHPFAVVTVWCAADVGQHLSRLDVETRPFYELLDIKFRGATQTIGADAASETDAELLEVPVGSPVLRCERVTTSIEGRPVLVSEYLFPAHRTEFVVELPHDEPSLSPTGLRLVEP